ncbi:unnamed protein product [Calypogeia fissa]
MRITKQQKGSGQIVKSSGVELGQKLEMENLIGSMTLVLQQPDMDIEELDASRWGELPDELVDRVLACLPVPLLLQLRCVCKRWNSLITSAPFLKLQAAAPYSGPHFLVFELQKPSSWGAYDARLQKWYTVPLDPLEGEIVMSMASDGGLLCKVVRRNWMQGPTCIVLSNPVTKCRRKLPNTKFHVTPTWIPSLVVLVVDQATNSYKVVVAGSKGCPHGVNCMCRVTEVYDSISDRWETTGNLPLGYVLLDPPSYAVCGGHIYCIASRFEEEFILVAYDLKRKVWNEIRYQPMLNLPKSQVVLFERRGSLVLVHLAGVPKIYTWKPGCHGEWTEVNALLPRNRMFEDLFRSDPDLACGGKEDLIFFVSHKCRRAWLYDISHRTWTITSESKFLKVDHKPPLLGVPFDFNLQLLSH